MSAGAYAADPASAQYTVQGEEGVAVNTRASSPGADMVDPTALIGKTFILLPSTTINSLKLMLESLMLVRLTHEAPCTGGFRSLTLVIHNGGGENRTPVLSSVFNLALLAASLHSQLLMRQDSNPVGHNIKCLEFHTPLHHRMVSKTIHSQTQLNRVQNG